MEKELYLKALTDIQSCIAQIEISNKTHPHPVNPLDNLQAKRELEREIKEMKFRTQEFERQLEVLMTTQLQQEVTKHTSNDLALVQYAIHQGQPHKLQDCLEQLLVKMKTENGMIQRELANSAISQNEEVDSKQVLQKAKELQLFEQQERITKQALEREATRLIEQQRQIEIQKLRVQSLQKEKDDKTQQIEDRYEQMDQLLGEKAKLIRQKTELSNLLAAIEQNVRPTEFSNHSESNLSDSYTLD